MILALLECKKYSSLTLFVLGTAGDDEPSDPYLSPAVLRSRQDAAYRSVAALQLRVEELTLEVTKVRIFVLLSKYLMFRK